MAESLKPSWWIPFVKDIQFTLAWWTENWPASAVIIQQMLKQKWSVVVHWPLGIICDTMRQIASPYLTLSERESWASALFFFFLLCVLGSAVLLWNGGDKLHFKLLVCRAWKYAQCICILNVDYIERTEGAGSNIVICINVLNDRAWAL